MSQIVSKIPVLHVYIPSKTTKTYTQRLVAKIPTITYKQLIQKHKHKHRGSLP